MLVRLSSEKGEIITRARLNDGQRRGSVFVPIHWSDRYASSARVDALVGAHVDPVSGQPESKYTPVHIEPYRAAWYGFLLSRRRLELNMTGYWACARGDGVWRYALAGEQHPEEWAKHARALLCAPDSDVGWIEYYDGAAQRYRAARLVDDRLESCLFVGPEFSLPSQSHLQAMFTDQPLDARQRLSLLSGRPADGQETSEPAVCVCFNVGRTKILQAIQDQGLDTVEEIGALLKAGTNCGSCVPELRGLLGEVQKKSA
jgi:assimilatory nitrate reductase catalytic subunit